MWVDWRERKKTSKEKIFSGKQVTYGAQMAAGKFTKQKLIKACRDNEEVGLDTKTIHMIQKQLLGITYALIKRDENWPFET